MNDYAFFACLGFITGVALTVVLCAYMWVKPATECEEYKQIVAEQQAIIERYHVQNETVMTIIDELLKEGEE